VAALHQIATGHFWPDAILLDLMMPRLDGDDFLASLDAINHTQEIALVAMTALPRSGVPESVRRRARSILFKPFSVAQVVAALSAALKRQFRRVAWCRCCRRRVRGTSHVSGCTLLRVERATR
jgi:CheY-like chemotaxis protein